MCAERKMKSWGQSYRQGCVSPALILGVSDKSHATAGCKSWVSGLLRCSQGTDQEVPGKSRIKT